MYKAKKFLAIIPARSGSKGLKDKNIKNFMGKPLIAYTIESAVKTNIFDDIIVSTDSVKYAEIARTYGATTPFLRPTHLASDDTNTNDVLIHTINQLQLQGKSYDYFVLLQPTSPLRDELHIIEAIETLLDKQANSIVSVCEVEHPSVYNIILDGTHRMDNFLKDKKMRRRQDSPKEYRLNGAIYVCQIDYFLKNGDFYREDSYAYIMDKRTSIDIDDEYDFKMAEFIYNLNFNNI